MEPEAILPPGELERIGDCPVGRRRLPEGRVGVALHHRARGIRQRGRAPQVVGGEEEPVARQRLVQDRPMQRPRHAVPEHFAHHVVVIIDIVGPCSVDPLRHPPVPRVVGLNHAQNDVALGVSPLDCSQPPAHVPPVRIVLEGRQVPVRVVRRRRGAGGIRHGGHPVRVVVGPGGRLATDRLSLCRNASKWPNVPLSFLRLLRSTTGHHSTAVGDALVGTSPVPGRQYQPLRSIERFPTLPADAGSKLPGNIHPTG
jgi:hypothetical protein